MKFSIFVLQVDRYSFNIMFCSSSILDTKKETFISDPVDVYKRTSIKSGRSTYSDTPLDLIMISANMISAPDGAGQHCFSQEITAV